MASPPQPLVSPRVSQVHSSQVQPGPDSAEWQVANRQRLVAIELQRGKVQELERQAQQRELDDTTRRLEL